MGSWLNWHSTCFASIHLRVQVSPTPPSFRNSAANISSTSTNHRTIQKVVPVKSIEIWCSGNTRVWPSFRNSAANISSTSTNHRTIQKVVPVKSIEIWCSGNTRVSKTFDGGSIPSIPAKFNAAITDVVKVGAWKASDGGSIPPSCTKFYALKALLAMHVTCNHVNRVRFLVRAPSFRFSSAISYIKQLMEVRFLPRWVILQSRLMVGQPPQKDEPVKSMPRWQCKLVQLRALEARFLRVRVPPGVPNNGWFV